MLSHRNQQTQHTLLLPCKQITSSSFQDLSLCSYDERNVLIPRVSETPRSPGMHILPLHWENLSLRFHRLPCFWTTCLEIPAGECSCSTPLIQNNSSSSVEGCLPPAGSTHSSGRGALGLEREKVDTRLASQIS